MGTHLHGKKNFCNVRVSNISFYYTNARSIRNKIPEFKTYIGIYKPEIVGITESWLSDMDLDDLFDDIGYSIIRLDRKDRKGGGILILIKFGIEYYICDDLCCQSGLHFEAVCLQITFGHFAFKLCICYRTGPDDDESLVYPLISEVGKTKSLIMGDFNIPDIDWEQHTASSTIGQRFLDTLQDNFLFQNTLECTRGKKYIGFNTDCWWT